MPRLIIDDLEIEVPSGTKVIDAAERLGIMIPRFCYHEALGSVGACRMCAVKFLQGPFKGIQMSCMIDAQDGMVVCTTDEEAVAFRKQVIEWLMINHPHDCPVCDEGGQCLLQDETVSGGHGRRRYLGKKRTYRDQYLGPFIAHEMNRCIHCYRCSRFYQEFAGYHDLGPLQLANKLYFGRFADGSLESPFSGNLVDVCPTGVYTDKTARFKVRRWDLQRAPSVCNQCSLGCNTVGNAHYRAVMRVEARLNKAVNGYFICDRGRFGFSYTNGGADHSHRPWQPRIGTETVSVEDALRESAQRLAGIVRTAGAGAVAALGSCRSSLETQCMLNRVCRTNNWTGPSYFYDPVLQRKIGAAVGRLDEAIGVSLREIETADLVIVAGADLLNEAPMAALAVRQAARKKAAVLVLDPRPVSLPLDFEYVAAAPRQIEPLLGAVIGASFAEDAPEDLRKKSEGLFGKPSLESEDPAVRLKLGPFAEKLKESKKPVIVCGTDVVRESTPAFAADCAGLLRESGKDAGLFYIFPGASSFSAALLSGPEGMTFSGILEGIESGAIKALVVAETDPFRDFPDRERLDKAFSGLELLIALDCLPTETVQRAHIFHPASTVFEAGSTFVNQEGRVQFAEQVHRGGMPIWGAHPPRVYRDYVPGGDHRPAWEILWKISGDPAAVETGAVPPSPGEWIAAEHPAFERIGPSDYPVDGQRVLHPAGGTAGTGGPPARPDEPKGLELLLVDWMYGTEELSSHADTLKSVILEPKLLMHPADAASAGLVHGDTVVVELDRGNLEIKLSVSEGMARGVLVLPRHRDIEWQKVGGFGVTVPPERIRKVFRGRK